MTLACFEKPELSRALQIERTEVELPDHNMSLTDSIGFYPEREPERASWILARRGARNPRDPFKPHAFLVEEERLAAYALAGTASALLRRLPLSIRLRASPALRRRSGHSKVPRS